MAKPFRTGHAAATGLTCALLASSGFSADETILEGRHGLLEALSPLPDAAVQSLGRDLGIKFHLESGIKCKPFASCTATHSTTEAMLRLREKNSISLDSTRLAVAVDGPARRWRVRSRTEAWRLLYGSNLAEHLVVRATTSMDTAGRGGAVADLRVEGGAVGKIAVKQASFAGRYDSVVSLQGDAALGNGDVKLGLAAAGVENAAGHLEVPFQRSA
jgi:hypothetical protein